jgi:RNA-directed DNA polymerase
LLANLFMHYAFDTWMARTFPTVGFERYCDDVVVHCVSERQARFVRDAIATRLAECGGLQLHPDKTKIVYCKDINRPGSYEHESFDFLGYTFRPRLAQNGRTGVWFVNFTPAISAAASKRIGKQIRAWRLHRRSDLTFQDLAHDINPVVRGWINYYGRYRPSELTRSLGRINEYLVRWAMRKYKRLRRAPRRTRRTLADIATRVPRLFAHWQVAAPRRGRERLDGGSRVSREVHARF